MKLHLPVFLRKSLLSCLSAFIVCTVGSSAAWAEPQNLTFEGGMLTWDTQSESFTDESDAAAAFTVGDNVSFTGESTVTLGEDIVAGTVAIEQGAAVAIDLDVFELNVDRIELSGLLDMGYSLHIGEGTTLAVQSAGAVLDSNLVLGEKGGFEVGAAASLNNNLLTLQGNTSFTLTAAGDGKTYTLLTGVYGLLDAQGNAISLDDTNNAASLYFDASQPGTGFWADGTLQLNNGALQLVLHNEAVKEVLTITSRVPSGGDYQYYKGISFENISSSADGGAIHGSVTMTGNGDVSFSGNTTASSSSYARGGAIYGYEDVTLSNNGSVTFSGNTASSTDSSADGGAIYGDTITLSDNGSVTFSGNTASNTDSSGDVAGGAICGDSITLNNNGIVMFEGNTASATDDGFAAGGGAIFGGSTITLNNNGSVVFEGNMASTDEGPIARGGAIEGAGIMLSNNGSVVFEGNMVSAIGSTACSYGGAIYGAGIMLSNNGSVTFSGNMARSTSLHRGGAICTDGDLSIRNNDSVEFYQNAEVFYQNAEVRYGFYRLRSIYADGDDTSLSAAEGKSIIFRDSIYIGSGSSFKLNEAYEGTEQQGDIVFTGATTVDDLRTVKNNVAGTEAEIRLSRTTEVNALTNLYGGRLRVEDGAIYQGQGITAHAGSEATVLVKDATLSHSGYDLTFNAGTTLELAGANSIAGNVQMLEGSWLAFDGAESKGMSWLTGNLSFTGGANVSLSNNTDWSGQNEILMYVDGSVSGWDENTLSIRNDADSSTDLRLVNGDLLVLNYNAETFKPYFKGDLTITTRQTDSVNYRYYNSVSFENIKYEDYDCEECIYGGAIDGGEGSTINLSYNGSVLFVGNTSHFNSIYEYGWYGGAIYGESVVLSNNGQIEFSGNKLVVNEAGSVCGGAIYGENGVTLNNNGSVLFRENGVYAEVGGRTYGGAVYGSITLSDNTSVEFVGNCAHGWMGGVGGAISGDATLSNNGRVEFYNNSAWNGPSGPGRGGAIDGDVCFSDNGSVVFGGNSVQGEYSGDSGIKQHDFEYEYQMRDGGAGGAICGSVVMTRNDSVLFTGNTISEIACAGGAIYGDSIIFTDNQSVEFSGNGNAGESGYVRGGAIYGGMYSSISFCNNGNVKFIGNKVSATEAYGGAIYTYHDLSIRNNESVLFEQNAEITDGIYRLRSIVGGGNGDVVSLSAAAGKSIEFQDSVYITSGSTVNLNEDYTYLDEEGVSITVKQQGDIIFTGATTVDDLYDVKGNVAGTEEEIRLSRTTEVNALTNLYGGRLRVEDGAIYQGQGIMAHAGSDATVLVKDATLSHEGYDLTFNAGTTLELTGANTITGNVQMLEGSTMRLKDATVNGAEIPLSFNAGTTLELAGANSITGNLTLLEGSTLHIDFAGNEFTTNLNGSPLALTGDAFLRLTGAGNGDGKTYTLLTGVSGLLDAQGNAISLDSSNNAISNYFDASQPGTGFWADGTLQLNDGVLQMVLHDEVVKESVTITTRQQGNANYQYYASTVFENITGSSSFGGAIYGGYDSTITLSNNGSVSFSGNSTSSSGGAIYGGGYSTITLSNNGSVTFSGNTVSSSGACGGAIVGDRKECSTITLSDNGSVTFSGNTASSSDDYAYGGAIYGAGADITLSHNDSVTFIGNTAVSTHTSASGGATCGSFTLSNNGSVLFSGNKVSGSSSACGGAIDGGVTMTGNGDVTFSGNTASSSASANGGAICGGSYWSWGWGGTITLSDNGSVVFEGNTVSASSSAYGGAIYTQGDLSIRNNDSVAFYQNAEVVNGNTYRLRSIYAYGGSDDEISLSAAAGKSITFRDSIYIGEGSSFKLNEAYEGKVQLGDIIFTGATTVDDLFTVKGNVAGTEEEIRLSRTTEVNALTNLYGGRLRVEDGAIYQGQGITAHAGSEATVLVKDATLSHSGYDLTFNAGTTLELAGSNTITGNVQMLEGSTLRFDFGADAVSSLTGSLSFEDASTLQVAGYGAGTHELLRLNGSTVSGWDALSFTDGAGVSIDAADFVMWEDSLFYRNGEAMNLIWTNAAGDALWNNQSLNWSSDGTPYAVTVLQHVVFAAGGNETITMVGNQVVESLTVQQGGQYVLNGNADGTTLTVREEVLMEGNTALTVRGNLEAAAINAQGSLEVTGNLAVAGQLTAGSLTLSDATATHTVGGNVTLSGAATVAGTLEVSGSFTSGAVQVKKLMADGTVSTGAISSSDNSLTATGNMTTGAVTGARNELTSTGGYVLLRDNAALNGSSNKLNAAHVVQVGTITGDGNELVAGKHVDINGSLNGDENSITCNATVNTTDNAIDISGTIGSATNTADDNALYAVRGNIRTGAITGSGNTLTAQDGNITTGAITGNGNVLSAVNGAVTAGAIAGTGNVVTAKSLQAAGMEGASLTLTDATATNRIDGNVTLSGAATVAGMLEVEGDVSVSGQVTAASLTAASLTAGALTLTDATATHTVSGNVSLGGAVNVAGALQIGGDFALRNGASVANHTIAVGGSVSVAGTSLTSTVISGATGNITISNSRLTDAGLTTSAGNVSITGDIAAASLGNYTGSLPTGNKHDKVGFFKTSMENLGLGTGQMVSLSSITLKERQDSSSAVAHSGVRLVLTDADGNVVAKSSNAVDICKNGADLAFSFAPGTIVDGSATYKFSFENAEGAIAEMAGFSSVNDNSATHYYSDGTVRHSGWSIAVKAAGSAYDNVLHGSTVETRNGTLSLNKVYTAAANGKDTSLNSLGGTATISSSVIDGGTNVAAGVLVIDGSVVQGNVNLETKGLSDSYINVKSGSLINIDGGAAHDASVYVGSNLSIWNAGALAGNVLNIANADVQVGNITNLNGEITTNLTNVYAVGENDEISASDLGKVYASNKDGKRGVLNITGSVIEMYGIQSSTYENWNLDGTAPGHYFDEVNVADSTVTVNHRGHIKALTLESDSMVSILGGAYLDTASIDSSSSLITGGASKLDEVNMVEGATLRVTNTGNGVTTLANLNPGSTGTVTVDVVNGTLQTPVVNERVALGLNGGTLLIKAVEAHGTALGASVAAVNPHVVLASVSNAGAAEVTQISTIRMDGLNRLGSDEAKNDGIASLTVKGAFDADKITINAYKLATDEGNTSGFIQIDGALTGADNILNADAHILVKGVLSGSGNTLTAYNGNVTLNATHQSLNGSNNTISATGGNVNLTDDMIGSRNAITVVAVDGVGGSILSANKWASVVGDTNTLTADDDILLESIGSESVAGNNNVLNAGDSITINGTGNGTGINGSGNTLTAGTSIASRNIKGDRNQLTADEITATIVDGTGNALTGTTVDITGELKGSANTVEGNEIHVGTVSGTAQEIISNGVDNAADIAIDIDTLSGMNAVIGVLNDGSLNIDSMTAQTGSGDTGSYITVLKGNVGIGTLNTTAENTISVGESYGITVGSGSASNQTWTAGSLAATGADGLTLTDSTVRISGAVENTAELNLAGDTALTATSVQAGTLRLDGADVMLSADSVVADEVVVDTPANNTAVFNELVADKVTVTNASSLPDNLSVGGGSVIGELVADKLEVREGTATLGSTAKQTEQELQSIALQKGADLVLQGQTSLSVTDSVAMTAGSEVQIQSGATLQNGAVALSAAPGTAAAQLNSKTGANLVEMQRDTQFSIHDMLLVNTSISAAEGNTVTISGVEGSENLHLLGGADFTLTIANSEADDAEPVIVYDSPVTGLALAAGSTLTLAMDPSNNDFRDYNLVINMSGFEYEGGILAATGGISDLNAAGIYLGGWLGEMLAAQGVAQEGMGNLESPEVPGDSIPTVSYTYSTENNVGMIISIHGLSVPEPTTTTLSLLSLCALAARRRRR